MKVIPPKIIDGVSQDSGVKEGAYLPKGILSHNYFPPELVLVSEYGNDLSYMASYWSVDRIWKLYIPNVDVYERLRDKLLQQRNVVVDYTDMNNLGIFIPKNKYFSGIDEYFKTVLDDLRSMDREALDRHLMEVGHMSMQQVLDSHYEKLV
jgi:hypothetical protein